MDNSEAPKIYNRWVAISMIAAVLERKVFLTWDKRLYPNFYTVLVGPPGCRKGTAMGPGRAVLEEMNVKIAADATTKEKLASRLKEASDNFEALDGQIHTYAALSIFSEEFTVFLGYGNVELMQWMSDWYDCKPKWKYETKHQGVDEVDGVWVNLLGATTPELLQESMPRESFGGGLNSRIIYIFADRKEKLVIFPFEQEGKSELREMISRDLQIMRLTSGEFVPDESYLKRWKEWYPKQHNPPQDDKMAGYMHRRPTHIHKLSMVFNASRGGNLTLTDVDFDRAVGLLSETERNMNKTFAGVGQSQFASVMNRALQMIRLNNEVLYSDLLAKFYFDADDSTMSMIIATLERANLIKLKRTKGHRDFYCIYRGKEDTTEKNHSSEPTS
jgi:hypothetical protein